MNYVLHLLIYLCIYLVIAVGVNLIMGWLGRLSLAHASLVAIGAYVYALATVCWGWGFVEAFALVAISGFIGSLLLSLPSWRFHGDYFVMISLAVQALIYSSIRNWYSSDAAYGSWANLTNGPIGVPGIPAPSLFGFAFDSLIEICVLYVGIATLLSLLVFRMTKSHWGRLLMCLRDDEIALRGLGVRAPLHKVQAFAIGGVMMAFGGAMYASYIGYIDPSVASLDESILWLSVAVVGGLGAFRGSLVGALVILLIPELLRFADLPMAYAANLRYLTYGVIIFLLMHLRPQGLVGRYEMGES